MGYSTDPKVRRRAGVMLSDLRGIRRDVDELLAFFLDEMNYTVSPNYDGQDVKSYRVDWNSVELINFLQSKAKYLSENLLNDDVPHHDGLVVLLSCHGMEDRIWTSD